MKKNILPTFLIACLAAWMSSCELKDNLDPVGQWNFTSPVLVSPNNGASVILDEANPFNTLDFKWDAAVSDAGYLVTYSLLLVDPTSSDAESYLFKVSSANNGRATQVSPTFQQIDQALSAAGYEAGSEVNLVWRVVATCMDKTTHAERAIVLKRFATEAIPLSLYLTGSATEAGESAANAISMRALKDADGNPANVFEVYTSFTSSGTYRFLVQPSQQSVAYGGSGGALTKAGSAISSPGEGTWRITVDFNTNTYSLLKIDKWSLVGNGVPGGWGGDVPLAYIGNGIWRGAVDFMDDENETPRFIFRANGDWAYIIKQIQGTADEVYMESQAASAGLSLKDVEIPQPGRHIVTLNLSGNKYRFSTEVDNSVTPPSSVPESLFLLSGTDVVAQMVKNGNRFESNVYLALQASLNYSFNSREDGSGTTYNLAGLLGETDNPGADKPAGVVSFGEGGQEFTVARDQAYKLTVNFETANVSWHHYNMKLFHWADWDSRNEFVMAYKHPYRFEVTAQLNSGHDMKFNSPWDIEFGADDPQALSGSMTNKGGSNFKCITQTGNYKIEIEIANDYSVGTYQFVKQ